MKLPKLVTINDVMLRDGLQLEQKLLSVDEKYRLVNRLIEANVKVLEFGSFVHPKLVPQMANSGELLQRLLHHDHVTLIALIPNIKGAEIAVEHQVKQLNYVFSASNSHNLQNVKQTTEQSLEEFKNIKELCEKQQIKLDVSIATSFGCPFEGNVPLERIYNIVKTVISEGVNTITLADTTGVANPKQVYYLAKHLLTSFPNQLFNLHFHNTRGMGLTNVLAGLQAGITSFDAALGGLGGCPFAPGATGNISTEDVVHMLHSMDVETGINLDSLLETSKLLREYVGHELSSSVLKSGKYNRIYEIPNSDK